MDMQHPTDAWRKQSSALFKDEQGDFRRFDSQEPAALFVVGDAAQIAKVHQALETKAHGCNLRTVFRTETVAGGYTGLMVLHDRNEKAGQLFTPKTVRETDPRILYIRQINIADTAAAAAAGPLT